VPRIELPPGLSPEEERAVLAALDRALGTDRRPSPWALAGRAENLGMGALQLRREARGGWTSRALIPFVRRGTEPLLGRGDAK
jgi:hypothetical protein